MKIGFAGLHALEYLKNRTNIIYEVIKTRLEKIELTIEARIGGIGESRS